MLSTTRCVDGFGPHGENLILQQISHGSNRCYPSLLLMRRMSNCINPREDFGDIHHQDFILMASRVSCRKLEWLILGPYQRAVLCCGVDCHQHCDAVESWETLMGMEYAGSVGTMVLDELAEVNERVSGAIDIVDECILEKREKVTRLEEKVAQLETDHHLLRREVALQKVDVIMLTTLVSELLEEVRGLRRMNPLFQHGPANLIEVRDKEEGEVVEDSEVEGWGGNDEPIFLRWVVVDESVCRSPSLKVGGRLVPIEDGDEDPRDPSHEIERAEEWEELRRRHLTMDDQAWREAMEMEQLSCIDPVPGYIPAPGYDDLSHPDPDED